MGPTQSIKTCLAKPLHFKGRAARSEYWWFFVVTVLLSFLFMAIDVYVFQKDFLEQSISFWSASDTFAILSSLPIAAVGARRLHDISIPGWPSIVLSILLVLWTVTEWGTSPDAPLSNFIYVVAVLSLFLLVAAIVPSNRGPNQYGPNPNEVPS